MSSAGSVSECYILGLFVKTDHSKMESVSKAYKMMTSHEFTGNVNETFKGLGLSQQTAFCCQKALLAGIALVANDSMDALWVYSIA